MKILILGQGGREHALVKALRRSSNSPEIHVLPGSDGMKNEALCFTEDSWKNSLFLQSLCEKNKYDFIFIGPEDPLVEGVSDRLRQQGYNVVGPSQYWAQLEGSKIFAKEFMVKAGIPTSSFVVVSSVEDVKNNAKLFTPPYVLKADGLAAGKGVIISDTLEELYAAAENMFVKKTLGEAGSRALLEQFTPGWELSYLFFTNGQDYVSLPIAQDHKRLFDGQKGPNTGGMGTWAPLEISKELDHNIRTQVIQPTMKQISQSSSPYRGVIFLGIMVNGTTPSVLEYNVRMGDPETQSILPLIDSDLAEFLSKLAHGDLSKLTFNKNFATCVVLASPGYPDNPQKGLSISGYDSSCKMESHYFIASGVKNESSGWVTNGGRVLGAVGIADSKHAAIQKAYDLAKTVTWNHIHYRTDIGKT
ncbi:MAG: phosphoribosylamine--glycine ligase [Bdellovibrionaceae bacterium]|nr:phosphoribosylamine--glycine ligase [Pseudobdellovibrionaceae bacterium]